jgi:hypothetical protein
MRGEGNEPVTPARGEVLGERFDHRAVDAGVVRVRTNDCLQLLGK